MIGYTNHRFDDSAFIKDVGLEDQGVSIEGGGQSFFTVFAVGNVKPNLESLDTVPYFFAGGGGVRRGISDLDLSAGQESVNLEADSEFTFGFTVGAGITPPDLVGGLELAYTRAQTDPEPTSYFTLRLVLDLTEVAD